MTRAAVIAGVGGFVPPRVVTNDELAQRLDTSDTWIRTRTGIAQRHVVDPGMTTGDLAVEAGLRALKNAGAEGADLVIVATTTPDRPCPATAPSVATRIGLTDVPAYDVAAVCSGFVYALQAGTAAITSGFAERVLVIGAESFSTILDPGDRTTSVIFGDGAGAVLLRTGDHDEPGAVLDVHLGSDGSMADLITVRGGGAEERSRGGAPREEDRYFRMEGKSVFFAAVRRMTGSSRTVLERTGWEVSDVDRLVGHQANTRILHAVAEQLGLPPERAVLNIDRVGNTSAASIPLALADGVADGELKAGDRVLLTAFGGGATWGSATLTWPDLPVD
ncbi:3-oxoacyl-[acyl-carrier-protein] synthase 3 protein 5 [Streptomyces lavendulae subsp. lavendulae]|uniref:beta-ketoacyl-ACP synthase III n=1 Tax=Streptomyces lavendulae TaxID=1914 RepID=UPI0024A0F378|nr:beta-ketoacyl-ACP synthase III [Streptomyces lavendulae]GLV86398.1 3-oxoacyl-[acyl-carrier-protein] synthase 3 protein 5 [Streptomyces lavendulae subsp. lavendulae]